MRPVLKKKISARPQLDFGPLPDLLGYVLRRAQLTVFHDFNQTFAGVDIRPAQYSVLTIIERNPGLTQSAVAESLGIKRTNFVALFNTLEKRGLARRQLDADDKRSHALTLTPAGAAFLATLHALAQQHEKHFEPAVTASEKRQLFVMLNAIRARGRKLRSEK